jgi:hypothetical protein
MWVEWSVGGAADLAERNPKPPTGGEAYTVLLCAVFYTPPPDRPAPWTAQGVTLIFCIIYFYDFYNVITL